MTLRLPRAGIEERNRIAAEHGYELAAESAPPSPPDELDAIEAELREMQQSTPPQDDDSFAISDLQGRLAEQGVELLGVAHVQAPPAANGMARELVRMNGILNSVLSGLQRHGITPQNLQNHQAPPAERIGQAVPPIPTIEEAQRRGFQFANVWGPEWERTRAQVREPTGRGDAVSHGASDAVEFRPTEYRDSTTVEIEAQQVRIDNTIPAAISSAARVYIVPQHGRTCLLVTFGPDIATRQLIHSALRLGETLRALAEGHSYGEFGASRAQLQFSRDTHRALRRWSLDEVGGDPELLEPTSFTLFGYPVAVISQHAAGWSFLCALENPSRHQDPRLRRGEGISATEILTAYASHANLLRGAMLVEQPIESRVYECVHCRGRVVSGDNAVALSGGRNHLLCWTCAEWVADQVASFKAAGQPDYEIVSTRRMSLRRPEAVAEDA